MITKDRRDGPGITRKEDQQEQKQRRKNSRFLGKAPIARNQVEWFDSQEKNCMDGVG